MPTYTLVRTFWFGPLPWRGTKELVHEQAEEELVAAMLDAKGLYQVVGNHPAHGPNTLLYVGVAGINGKYPTIGARLASHWKNWARFEDRRSLAVHLGVPTYDRKVTEVADALKRGISVPDLRRLEALTIWWHSPPYNVLAKAHSKAKPDGDHLLVQSWGDRGRLAMEYSSDWELRGPMKNDSDASR